eukprot:8145_1
MMQNAFVEGMVQQNTTRPHFTYADRVIKYLIHPELIASEVTKLSVVEQCLLVRDFMNRNQPEQYVRAEPIPRDTPLPAVTFTQKIMNKKLSQHQEEEETKLNQISTPISPPSSPLIYPSSDDALCIPSDPISFASFTSKLPSSCDKYLLKRKKPAHYLHSAGKIVVLCDIKLEDLEAYIPHLNLKKLIKYIITAGMNAPPTTQNSDKTKYILKSKLWKPTFQRWVINSLIDSGSSDILGHSAKHITNIQRGADTTINVLTYYMRLTTATREKKIKKSEEDNLTKPSWECIENGPKMFTLKGESSDEEGDNNGSNPNDMSECDTEDKKRKIVKYYEKWKSIYGEDVSDLTAFMIQERCIEKYEICCDIARYYFINENWKKAKKWFNRAARWYLRVDQKKLMSQKHLHLNQMISNKRYEWDKMWAIIGVLNVIIGEEQQADVHNMSIYECCQWVIKGHDLRISEKLCDIWKDKETLDGLSLSLLNVWLHEMRAVCGETVESVCYFEVFVMVYSMYRDDCNANGCHMKEALMKRQNGKYFAFYMRLIDAMCGVISDKDGMYEKAMSHVTFIEVLNKEDEIILKMKIDAEEEETLCWSERIMSIESSDAMKELLSQLIDNQDNDTYNMAMHYIINKCYVEDMNPWMDVLNHVMLSMISKHNRDQIAFIKLLSEMDTTLDLEAFMERLSMKLNGITAVASLSGLYALFGRCFAHSNKRTMMRIMHKVCNHLYSVIFGERRKCEVCMKKMSDSNEIYQAKYASMMYANYLDKESLLNLFINQTKLIESIHLIETKQHCEVLYRYLCDLCRNIKFVSKKEATVDINSDYLYRVETDTNMKLFCSDSRTQFLFELFCTQLKHEFVDIISPLIVGLIHINKNVQHLFLSFKGNKYYEFIQIAGMQSQLQMNPLIDKELTQLIARNMNKLLTFVYYVYHFIWNNQCKDVTILHKCSDILFAKSNQAEALQLLMDNTNCAHKSKQIESNGSYISNEYGAIFCNDKIFSHFIYLCCLNGSKIEAVLLWQLSTDPKRITYAKNIINNELTVKHVENHIRKHPQINLFECIWEPLILCELKLKFENKSLLINQKLDQYLASAEMGTDPKLKANKLCDFVFNNLLVR